MLRWLRSLLAWREVRNTGVHSYQQNAVTGKRRVLRCMAGGYQPVDWRWLQGLPPAAMALRAVDRGKQ